LRWDFAVRLVLFDLFEITCEFTLDFVLELKKNLFCWRSTALNLNTAKPIWVYTKTHVCLLGVGSAVRVPAGNQQELHRGKPMLAELFESGLVVRLPVLTYVRHRLIRARVLV